MRRTFMAAVMAAVLGMFMAPRADAGLWDAILRSLGFDASRPGKFEVYQSPKDHQFYFHLKAGNGQIVLMSEGYKAIEGARGGIDAIIRDAKGLNAQLVQSQPPKGKWHFVWRSGNYQVTGASSTYSSKAHAQKGAETVIRILQNKPAIVFVRK